MLMNDLNWMQIRDYLEEDDRILLVTGSVEEHGYNDVGTDTKAAFEVAKAACEETGVMLAPAINYAFAGWVESYPGTVSIKPATFMALVRDVLESLANQGFKRILVLNGHGQNEAAANLVIEELATEYSDIYVKFRSWYMLPNVYDMIEGEGTGHWDHGSWLESFPWINVPEGVEIPDKKKPSIKDFRDYLTMGPEKNREILGDGTAGSDYKKSEEFMRKYFQTAVQDAVAEIEGGWEKEPVRAE